MLYTCVNQALRDKIKHRPVSVFVPMFNIFGKTKITDKTLGNLQWEIVGWKTYVPFEGDDVMVLFVSGKLLGPAKAAKEVWVKYRVTIESIWRRSQYAIVHKYGIPKFGWAGGSTEFNEFKIGVFNPRESNGLELTISFQVEHDRKHYYSACYKKGELFHVEKVKLVSQLASNNGI